MNAEQFGEHVKRAAVDAMQKLSDNSVEYAVATRGGGTDFAVSIVRRPESQIEERSKRKANGQRLY